MAEMIDQGRSPLPRLRPMLNGGISAVMLSSPSGKNTTVGNVGMMRCGGWRTSTTNRAVRRHRGADFLSVGGDGACGIRLGRRCQVNFVLGPGTTTDEDEKNSCESSGGASASRFCPSAAGDANKTLWVEAATVAAVNAGSATLGGTLGCSAGVDLACLPIFPPQLWASAFSGGQSQNSDEGTVARIAQDLQQSLTASCMVQAVFSTLDFALNDPITGLIGCGIATLGIQAASPSGYRFLPSYIVLSFCNGTMQVLLGLEFFAGTSGHSFVRTLALPLSAKIVHLVSLASPALMFVGLALAWKLHVQLRALALEVVPNVGGNSQVDAAASGNDGGIAQGFNMQSGFFRPFSGAPHRLAQPGGAAPAQVK